MGNRWQRIWGVSWGLLGLWSTSRPSLWWSSTRELSFYLPLCCVRLCDVINRDVRYTMMIYYIICRLMCVTDPWAHMSFMHSILSLKLGVTVLPPTTPITMALAPSYGSPPFVIYRATPPAAPRVPSSVRVFVPPDDELVAAQKLGYLYPKNLPSSCSLCKEDGRRTN